MIFESLDEVRRVQGVLSSAAATLSMRIDNRNRYQVEDAKRLQALADEVYDRGVTQFGVTNPRHPECQQCKRVSVFGGPDHEPGFTCQSGKQPHCSCDCCF